MSGIELIDVYLFPQGIDGLLNVGEVHGLNIADDWYNEPLQRTVTFRSVSTNLPLKCNKRQRQGVKGRNLWSCNSDADVHVISVDDLFGRVIDDCGLKGFSPVRLVKTQDVLWRLVCRGHTCIDSRLIGQSVSSSLDKRRHEAQLDVVLLQESVLMKFPHFLNVADAQVQR